MEAARINYILSEKQLAKFCNMFGIDLVCASALNEIACLNTDYIRDILVKYDYEELCHGIRYMSEIKPRYGFDDLAKALAKEYRTTPANIKSIVNGKENRNMCFCSKCGKRIKKFVFGKNNGLCTDCLVETLEL